MTAAVLPDLDVDVDLDARLICETLINGERCAHEATKRVRWKCSTCPANVIGLYCEPHTQYWTALSEPMHMPCQTVIALLSVESLR